MKIKQECLNIIRKEKGYEDYFNILMAVFFTVIIINPIQGVS